MNGKVWVIDDDNSIRWVLEKALQQVDLEVTSFEGADDVMDRLEHARPDVIISDIRMPGMDGLELLKAINQRYPELPVIIMTAYSDMDSAVAAFKGGAFEYLPKPFDIDDAVELVRRALTVQGEVQNGGDVEGASSSPEIIGSAPAMQEVFRAIGRLSGSNMTVLITGESGTGKELVARALHNHGLRAEGPFIALNMSAIPRELLESELFGHEKGAFTGALSQRRGRFEQADGGSIFLDEIGDMPAELQTRLLRVLAEGEFYRVGGHNPVRANVRVIAATNRNLEQQVEDGTFREDLFHRLNVIRVQIPALKHRREDIPEMVQYFLGRAARESGDDIKILSPDAMEYIVNHDWPGNVRQLENVSRWLSVMSPTREITVDDLPSEIKGSDTRAGNGWQPMLKRWADAHLRGENSSLLDVAQPEFERILIQAALEKTGGRRQDAAKLIGWGRNTLTRKIKELGLDD